MGVNNGLSPRPQGTMNDLDLDMSRPGSELFPETNANNSYQGVNQEQVAEAPFEIPTGVNEPDVAGQGQQLSDKEMNFRAMRDEISKMQQEREYWKGQAEALKTAQPYQSQPKEPERQDPFKSFEEHDWESGKHVKQAFETLREENQKIKSDFKDQLAALEAKAAHPEWQRVVTQHVPELTSKNPIFAEMIRNTSNPYEAAYLLAELNAKASNAGSATVQQPINPNAQRALSNAQKPQSVSTVGGHGTLNAADYYASMSDEDFMKLAARNQANI